MTNDLGSHLYNSPIEAACNALWKERLAQSEANNAGWVDCVPTIGLEIEKALHEAENLVRALKRPEAVDDGSHVVTYETMTPDQIKEIIQEYRDDKEQLAHDFKTLWRNLNKHQLNRLSFMSDLGRNLQKEMREIYGISKPKEPKP